MTGMILLTGATGYIGSHTWLELLGAGHQVVGLDNFCNSSPVVLQRMAQIHGAPLEFVEGDVRDAALLMRLFQTYPITGAVHFAALKAVGESVAQPLRYYANNLNGLLALTEAMRQHDCKTLVFSSSATVYGNPHTVPITEDFRLSATNPYGQTKLMSEQILRDLEIADPHWRIAYLRYFNPVGAHESGLIGEDPQGIPNNLMPYIAQVAIGKREVLSVFGGDWPTPDGTGVRDYIHVVDLARGHVAALDYLDQQKKSLTVNLGTGRGTSVLQLVTAFAQASGREVPCKIVARRPGDIATCYADPALAKTLLGWETRYDVAKMCVDSWRWQLNNPEGFSSKG
ncbi:MAG: UDP-glucose 4-epimerase GalE [Burkholderiaceae bacterium]|nr:MAG: UDP-glucose 4-epimerase GalE [Burkholderiaceae bacterium]